MSGWIWLVGLLATVLVVWLILARRRAGREVRGGRRLVTDTEFSSEFFIPPEVRGGEAVPAREHPLPWSYSQTRLVLLVRDPYWLFAYWEVTGEVLALAEDTVGRQAWLEARPVLRVYDATSGSHYDLAVDEGARNWHLNVGQPDRTWYAELGRITATGRFVMLARSNTVHTPRDGPSDVVDRRWPPLGRAATRPKGMPASTGVAGPASPGTPGCSWTAGAGGYGEGGHGGGR